MPWSLISRLMLQVIVLSEGHQLYFGRPQEAVAWFSGSLGYAYAPAQDGAVSDWLMDLVSVGFSKRSDFGSRYPPCPPTHYLHNVGEGASTRKLWVSEPVVWSIFACLRWAWLAAGR